MKKFIQSISLIFLFLLSVFSQTQTIKVKVVGVVDGDTITVLMKDDSQKQIQLKGVDAPELPQAFGHEARQKLAELILNKNVSVEYSRIRATGTILGKVTLDGKDVGLAMLQSGAAWCDDEQEELLNATDETAYYSSETTARQQSTGLWLDKAALPPWEFRKTYVPADALGYKTITDSTTFKGQVMEVINGATIALKMANNSRIVICISRLETPESGQPKADIAQQHLKELLLQKNVQVTVFGLPEDENCTLGDVYLNDININLQMVRDGVAWANKNYYYPEGYYTFEAAEQAARKEHRGVWEAISPMAPWEYRAQYFRTLGNTDASSGYSSEGYSGSSPVAGGNKTVYVHGYTRKDGTYVGPYTRRAPSSGSSRSSSGGRRH